MKHLPLLLTLIFILTGHRAASAATIVTNYTVNALIPDNTSTGFTDTRTITGSTIAGITNVDLHLELSGGWNGDLYAYLSHSTGFAVALNRPGKTLLNTIGSSSSGMLITLSDLVGIDVHTGLSGSGVATGTYQPDGRNVDPSSVLDSSPRTSFLSSFNGLPADGTWTLFVADMSAADQSLLTGWGLTITGAVPEPSRAVLLMMGLGGLLMRRRAKLQPAGRCFPVSCRACETKGA